MRCLACVYHTLDRCPNQTLPRLRVCEKHAKAKAIRFWSEIVRVNEHVTLLQAIWKGKMVRTHLQLAGPGVLKRSVCHNEEEIVTMDGKHEVHPFEYFAFEEAGKIYWFDVKTMLELVTTQRHPINPYTREKLAFNVRQRLRAIGLIRMRYGLPMAHDSSKKTSNVDEAIISLWGCVCQILEENGIDDVHPLFLASFTRDQLCVFAVVLQKRLEEWAAEHTCPDSRRKRYPAFARRIVDEYKAGEPFWDLSLRTVKTVWRLLLDVPKPYELCFMVLSAVRCV